MLNFVFLGKLAAAISLIPCIALLATVLCMVELNPSVFGNVDADPITKVHSTPIHSTELDSTHRHCLLLAA